MRDRSERRGVALLITLFFIIAITAAVGVSLMNLRKSGEELHQARFLLQSGAVVDDVLALMRGADKLGAVTDAESLNLFLLTAGFIPLELKELLVKIEITSAMGHININALKASKPFQDTLIAYMNRFNVQDALFMSDLLIDCMSGYQDIYKTGIFDEMPELYRERIVSKRHFDKIVDFYIRERHDNAVAKLPWKDLLRFDDANTTVLDANYITPALWQMLIPGLEEERAIELSSGGGAYSSLEDIDLSPERKEGLATFNLSFYQPTVHLDIEIVENNNSANVAFDYDLTAKKGKHFEFGI
ncbi:hypothetical protein [Sulfurimonas sp. HSL3-7]|uniref:hypothetical protein n=1 Tax=Sulfonitrofixus jiaomeiensis TaxID=3131938 RepID=UPI0031F85EDD